MTSIAPSKTPTMFTTQTDERTGETLDRRVRQRDVLLERQVVEVAFADAMFGSDCWRDRGEPAGGRRPAGAAGATLRRAVTRHHPARSRRASRRNHLDERSAPVTGLIARTFHPFGMGRSSAVSALLILMRPFPISHQRSCPAAATRLSQSRFDPRPVGVHCHECAGVQAGRPMPEQSGLLDQSQRLVTYGGP